MASLRDIWTALRGSESADSAGDLRMRMCHSALDLRVFAAVSGGRRDAAVVIELPEQLLPRNLDATGGRRFSLVSAELPGLPSGRGAVVLQLRDEQFEDLFEQLGNCLIDELRASTSASAAIHGVVRLIERWRRFLEKHQENLGPEEVRGLIGELSMLERLAMRIGPRAALASWRSPFGSIRDFECPSVAVEVKTYMASAGATVRINDPLQLEPDSGIPLLLACQELARSSAEELTLPGHVARTWRLFEDDIALKEDFDNALASSGYLPSHAKLYTDGYALGATNVFEVRSGFPRISAATIPPFVSRVHFDIEILPLARFSVPADTHIGPRPM
jgi:hypothetical protein